MFVRVKSSPNSPKKTVQIVESIREGTKVKQRIVRHVGNALDQSELTRLKELAEHIKAKIELENQPGFFAPEQMAEMAIEARNNQDDKPLPVDLKKLREQQRIITGIHEVYGKVYHEIGFNKVFPNAARKPSAVKNLFHLVMGRLANPLSKRATVSDLAENFGIELSLPSVYRMMDLVDDKVIGNIQNTAYQCAREIFQSQIKVVFYDCTTLYFESFTEDELKKNGYSKDMKFNQPQVLLALMVTDHGLPIGYEVFPGSQYEGHTLKKAIQKIEEKYQIKQVVFVADSAMFNTDNLELLEGMGKHYIVAARIKNLPTKITNAILDKEAYKPINLQDDQKEYSFKELSMSGRRLIVTYNANNARKDAQDRQTTVDKLLTKIQKSKTNNPSELISNYGYKKFIKLNGDASFQIDDEKIEQAKQWDGLHGVITNNPDLNVQQVISQYHGLWQVEECFRISKHDLKVRPIFHWTPIRIKAHIAICFIALTCSRYLHYRVKTQQYSLSTERIRQLLISVQLSILKHVNSDKLYGVPSLIKQDTSKVYQVMGLKLSDVPFQLR